MLSFSFNMILYNCVTFTIFQISKGKNSFACMEGRYSVGEKVYTHCTWCCAICQHFTKNQGRADCATPRAVCVNFLRISNIIAAEKLSYSLPNIAYIWLFWFRLETTWHSKIQLGKSMENDPIMYEIMTMLSFGWFIYLKFA